MHLGRRFWEEAEPTETKMIREEIVGLAPTKGTLQWTLRAAEKIAVSTARAERKAAAFERSVRNHQRILVANTRADTAEAQLISPI
ncbi:hypothetical protein COT20_00015 [bacterium (Candidatus Gribaldobacteria) CG08_land_8_20_14_0_20_39_15]|uniref:Uncharacterized protein n=1 Tax=bacterium (Candidatus Gribaldobacteria) CG08_land_8_20_14_0_20_39_15 TaxID=2014273 RepID=A0A2M6XVD1_9BACT|nr:MAG: hypothetical protein COT20_00015 [bacterium (Candidatus Gribaldobacteria) CG08_land_8_20_14_0_20_39_15]